MRLPVCVCHMICGITKYACGLVLRRLSDRKFTYMWPAYWCASPSPQALFPRRGVGFGGRDSVQDGCRNVGVAASVRMRARANHYSARATYPLAERVAKYRHWLAVEGRTRLCLLCWSMKAIVVMHQETPGPPWWDPTLYSDHTRSGFAQNLKSIASTDLLPQQALKQTTHLLSIEI